MAHHRRNYEAQGFEWFWNSTFGVPQQLIFRGLRAAQDPNTDFFSHEGILDMSLIPFVGLFDDDRADVSMSEQVRRVNKLTGSKMDADSGWAQFGVGMLTDPLTFLSGGLTALGRTGASGLKAARTGSMPALLRKAGVDVSELVAGKAKMGRKEFMAHLDEALKKPLNGNAWSRGRQRGALKKARKEIGRLSAEYGDDVGQILNKSSDMELRLGLYVPFTNMGGAIYKNKEHKYWFKLLGNTAPMNALASGIKTVAGLPGIQRGTKHIAALRDGFKTGRQNLAETVSKYKGSNLDALGRTLTQASQNLFVNLNRRQRGPLSSQFNILVKEGMDPKRAFLKAIQANGSSSKAAKAVPVPRNKDILQAEYERYYRAFFGLSEKARVPSAKNLSGKLLSDNLEDFKATYKDASKRFENSFVDRQLTDAGKAEARVLDEGGKGAFNFGRNMKQLWGKIWKLGGSAKHLDESNALLTRYESQATESVRQMGVQLADALRVDAQALGMKTEDLDNFMLGVAQGQPMVEEIGAWVGKLKGKGENVDQAAMVIGNFVSRLEKTIGALSVQARQGTANSKLGDIMEAVSNRFAENVKFNTKGKIDYDYVYGADQTVPGKSILDQIGGDRSNKLILSVGRHKGKPLGTLTQTELGEVLTDIVGTAPRKKLTPAHLNKHWSRYTADMKEIRALRSELGLNFMSMLSLLQRAKKTGKVSMAGNKGGTRFKLTEEQSRRVLFVSRSDFEPALARNPNKLKGPARSQYNAVRKIQDARRMPGASANGNKVYNNLKPLPEQQLPPRIPNKVGASIDGERIQLNDLGRAAARLNSVVRELKRSHGQKSVGPHLIREIEGALNQVHTSWDDAIREVLGPNTRFMDLARDIQKKSLFAALEQGAHTLTSPLGYAMRIMSRNNRQMLEASLNSNGLDEVLQSALPTLGSTFARDLDNITVYELNEIYRKVKAGPLKEQKANEQFINLMNKIADEENLPQWGEKYAESMFHAVIGREGQAMRTTANVDYINAALKAGAETNTAVAGKLIGVAYGENVKIYDKVRTVQTKGTQRTGQTKQKIEDVNAQVTGLIIRGEDGTDRVVPMQFFDNESYTGVVLGEGYGNAASALGIRATRGKLDAHEVLVNSETMRKNAHGLIGNHVVVGEKATVDGIFGSMQNVWKNSGEIAIYYDNVQYLMKKFQTVFSPAFHLNNLASMFSQMLTIGTSPLNQVAATSDALRFLGTNKQGALAYDRFNLHTAAIKGGSVDGFVGGRINGLNFLDVIRKAGLDEIVGKSPEAILKEFPHLEPEDLIFKVGTQVYSMPELLEAWRSTNMFGTFMSEGLRGGSSVTRTLAELRGRVTASQGVRKFKEGAQDLMESSEVTARLSGFFGQLREGKGLIEAAENTKLAMVDYNKLTSVERFGIKRLMAYYTFPRHFLPHAANYFGQHANRMTQSAQLIKTDWLREERGRLKLDIGDTTFDATRVLPHLEALKVLETVGETTMDWLEVEGVTDNISTINRRESLRGRTPFPLTWGSFPTAVYSGWTGTEDTSGKDEMINSFWALRFAYDLADPTADKTLLQNLATKLTPVKVRDADKKAQEIAMVKRRLRDLTSKLEANMQATTDINEKELYRQELIRLTTQASEQIRDVTMP